MAMCRCRIRVGIALLLSASYGALIPLPVASQAALPGASSSCLADPFANKMTRVTVFAVPMFRERDSTLRAFVPAVDSLAQMVAARAREILGATPGQLPPGEPKYSWLNPARNLEVTAYRDGRLLWRISASARRASMVTDSTVGDSVMAGEEARRTGAGTLRPMAELLAHAAAELQAEGVSLAWPDSSSRDSLAFLVEVRRPLVGRGGEIIPIRVRRAFPLFSIAEPWIENAVPIQMPRPAYPMGNLESAVEATVILTFVVDRFGRADMSTVRDEWPANRPRYKGREARYYREFVASVREALSKARFEPARIGGCAIPQLVTQPFGFRMRR